MEFNLTIMERIRLLGALPREGNFATIRIVRKLREALSFSERETDLYGVVYDQTRDWYLWNPQYNDATRKFTLGLKALEVIRQSLSALNDQGKLTPDTVSLYDKFRLEKDTEEGEEVGAEPGPEQEPKGEVSNGQHEARQEVPAGSDSA